MTSLAADPRQIRKGLAITTLGGLLFTLDLPLLRLAAADKWTLMFSRGVLLFLAITAVWYFGRIARERREAYIAGAAGWAVVATNTLANITYIGAIKETAAANVVFITALIPIATAVMSRLLLKEPVHGWTWTATVLSIVGVGIIVRDSVGQPNLLGDMLAMVSCLCTAGAFTIVRASGKNVATSLGLGSLVSALIALPLADPGTLSSSGWLWVSLSGLVVIPAASILISNGPRFLPSADVGMFFLLETTLTPIWIYLIFAETPSPNVLLGGAIVIVTLVLHSLWRLASVRVPQVQGLTIS